MKKFLLIPCIFASLSLGLFVSADSTGCLYENDTYAISGEVAMDGSVCQADGTRKYLEVTYISSDAQDRYQRGLALGDKNNYKKAIEYILKAQKEYKGKIVEGSDKNGLMNILLDLSFYYIKDKQYQNALVTTNKILRLGIDYWPESKSIALNNKGAALDSLGKPDEAKIYYEQALDLDYAFDIASTNLQYANELMNTFSWLQEKKLTNFTDITAFRPYDSISKQHAAKYITDLMKKVVKKKIKKTKICKITDMRKADKNTKQAVQESCDGGLFAVSKGHFVPNSPITNEAAIKAIITAVYGTTDDYYTKAQEDGLLYGLDQDDMSNKGKAIERGAFVVILKRAYDLYTSIGE